MVPVRSDPGEPQLSPSLKFAMSAISMAPSHAPTRLPMPPRGGGEREHAELEAHVVAHLGEACMT